MIKNITSVKVGNRRVLLRAGFDVPLKQTKEKEHFVVADETRVKADLPTINYLIEQGAKIVIISHLGRPGGEWVKAESMWPVAQDLARLMHRKPVKINSLKLPNYSTPYIYFLDANIEEKDYSSLSNKLKPGEILFLENMRFYKSEEENKEDFIKILASYGDLFVNDAFSVAHRKEASTYGVAQKLKSYAGVEFMQEITALSKVLKAPEKPMIVLMGGAKISDKIDTIKSLAKHADKILIGGAIANAFIKAKGYEIGKSKVAEVDLAKELIRNFGEKLVLPIDVVVAKSDKDVPRSTIVSKIFPNDLIFDIGPETIRNFSSYIKTAHTLVWNGPMGKIEVERFAFGSKALAQTFASRSKGQAFGVVGGGETLEVMTMAKVADYIDHLSMGGGAMLEFLAGKKLPAIKVLEN